MLIILPPENLFWVLLLGFALPVNAAHNFFIFLFLYHEMFWENGRENVFFFFISLNISLALRLSFIALFFSLRVAWHSNWIFFLPFSFLCFVGSPDSIALRGVDDTLGHFSLHILSIYLPHYQIWGWHASTRKKERREGKRPLVSP